MYEISRLSSVHRLGSTDRFARPETQKPKSTFFLSVEGSKTERQYFQYVNKYREQLGIKACVEVRVLLRNDTASDPNHVEELLDECMGISQNDHFVDDLKKLANGDNVIEKLIDKYYNHDEDLTRTESNQLNQFAKKCNIDIMYQLFLKESSGPDDKFGVVLDRDAQSHSRQQMEELLRHCHQKNYFCFITNPCIELWLLFHVCDVNHEYASNYSDILANKINQSNGNTYVSNLLFDKTNIRKGIQEKSFIKYFRDNIDKAIKRSMDFCTDEESLLDKIGSNLGTLFDILRKM